MARYRVKQTFNISLEGTQIAIPAGEVLNTENALAAKIIKQLGKGSEHLEDFVSYGQYDEPSPKVETATAAPGEKRAAPRAKK
jgi:hypothetical protein